MTVKSFLRYLMLQANARTGEDMLEWHLIPRIRYRAIVCGTIDNPPEIVLVSMRIKGDLLFYSEIILSFLLLANLMSTHVVTQQGRHERGNVNIHLEYVHAESRPSIRIPHLGT